MNGQSTHWADIAADKIIREKQGKDLFVCASGITPSGTVHIGNFREIISVALVVQALREKGKRVRFIYSWDDYDVFRKVPANMPNPEELEGYLRKSITKVPDPNGKEESYARANEVQVEKLLPLVGVEPEYIYQAKRYEASVYADKIRLALESRDIIAEILNAHRQTPLEQSWMPVSVFCTKCGKDTTTPDSWDGEWALHYTCGSCGNDETVDLRETGAVKLPWRIDWPMRWKHEGVDFEPAGKDHHSEGGSFDTAKEIVARVYGGEPPVTFQYDFIRIKGRGGKISSSSGEVISLDDVLAIYQPEVIRFMFAGTRPNAEFAISFDLDVLKIYEDYDRCERTWFTEPESEKARKKKEKQDRVYQFSQVNGVPEKMPYKIQIRHLCNLLQIQDGNIGKVMEYLGDVQEYQKERFVKRAECAWNWITTYAPEDFRFALRKEDDPPFDLTDRQREAVRKVRAVVDEYMDTVDEEAFGSKIYDVAREMEMDSSELFPGIYKALTGKEKGPRLISFLSSIGKERIQSLLRVY